jgi:hypothetical protein
MAHFAKLDEQNRVIAVVVGRNEDDENELTARTGETYKQTSYNTREGVHYGPDGLPDGKPAFRYHYAGIGMIYDAENNIFTLPTEPTESISNS